jgi:hypothetical protein
MGRTCFWVVNERPDGIEALCEDLAVSPTGIRVLLLAWYADPSWGRDPVDIENSEEFNISLVLCCRPGLRFAFVINFVVL